MLTWLGTITFVFMRGNEDRPLAYGVAVLGGLFAGILGAAREAPVLGANAGGWIGFRTLSTIVGSAIWVYILHDLWLHTQVDPQWMHFFIGVLVYTVSRDVCQISLTAGFAKKEAARKEAREAAQRERVLAIAKARAKASLTNEAPTGERLADSDARMGNGSSDAVRNQGDTRGYLAGAPDGGGNDADLPDEHLRATIAGTAPGLRILEDGQSDEDGSSGPTGGA
jgi:hypothetical protein